MSARRRARRTEPLVDRPVPTLSAKRGSDVTSIVTRPSPAYVRSASAVGTSTSRTQSPSHTFRCSLFTRSTISGSGWSSGQVVALDAIDPVDLEQEAPHVAGRLVVDAERLVDADRLLPVVRRRPLLGQAVERVPDRPSVALEERVDERACAATALRLVVERPQPPPVRRADDHARPRARHALVDALAGHGEPRRSSTSRADDVRSPATRTASRSAFA